MGIATLFGKPCDGKRTLLIAEAGINHSRPKQHRRMAAAKAIVSQAKEAGADAVKFQLFMPKEPLFCPLPGDESRWKRWNKSIMHPARWQFVVDHGRELGIPVFFSVFQHGAIDLCRKLGVETWKVASRAAKTFPYDSVSGPFIVSGGLGWPEKRPDNALFLQCKTQYPAPLADCWWREPGTDGISDHSGKMWPSIDAIVRGAKLIELHFYSGRGIQGRGRPDFSSSIKAHEFKRIGWCRDDVAAMRQN